MATKGKNLSSFSLTDFENCSEYRIGIVVSEWNKEITKNLFEGAKDTLLQVGIPSVNVCMNCHRDIQEGTNTGKEEIAKIHAAAGFDADKNQYTGEGTPIVWNKVHNLPDHVYFNHSQHVAVGKIDCAQCHGDVKNIKTGKVATMEELNAVEENSIKFTKQTLTMGWCLDCHNQAGIQSEGSEYYDEIHKRLKNNPEMLKKFKEDDQITVRELGGWECAKCHY